jgi:hypothetical protein
LVCSFGHEKIELEIELVVNEIKKIKLVIGEGIDLSLNEGGMIFDLHSAKTYRLDKEKSRTDSVHSAFLYLSDKT